jgi:ketopantoate hydroxymethyltransferase
MEKQRHNMAFKQLEVTRIENQGTRILLYGDSSFYVIANRGDVINVKVGDVITYEQSTTRYGYYAKNPQ